MDIRAMLQEEMLGSLIKEMGIEAETPEVQADLISKLGENILHRVLLEVLNVVPSDKQNQLAEAFQSDDFSDVENFLAPYVPSGDVDAFVRSKIRQEIKDTKSLANA